MRYQLRLPKSTHPDELADELALAAWGGVITEAGREGPDSDAYPRVVHAVREAVRARLQPLDACGLMHGCTDGAVPVAEGGPGADRASAIWGMELADGADGLIRDLTRAATLAAGLGWTAQDRIRARIAKALEGTLYRNELCGRPQCERIAEPVRVRAVSRTPTGGLAP